MRRLIIPLMFLVVFLSACGNSWEAPVMHHGEHAIREVAQLTGGEAVFLDVEWLCMLYEEEGKRDEMCVFFIAYERDNTTGYKLVLTSEPDGVEGIMPQHAVVPDQTTLDAMQAEMIEDVRDTDTSVRYDTGSLSQDTIDAWLEELE